MNNANNLNKNDYKLLCKDGSLQRINETCGTPSWTKQPRSLIVANSRSANDVKNWMAENMTNYAFTTARSFNLNVTRRAGALSAEDLLQRVLYEGDTRKIALATAPKTLQRYMEGM